jgi:enterochelin esterase-like enzyme
MNPSDTKKRSAKLGQKMRYITVVAHTELLPYIKKRKNPTMLNSRLATAKIKQH